MTASAFAIPQLYRAKHLSLGEVRQAKEKMDARKRREFLTGVHRLVAAEKSRKALARIYDFLDDLVLHDHLSGVDETLKEVDVEELDPTCILGFLSITFPVRDRLPAWAPLLVRSRAACMKQGVSEDKIERLFGALG